MFITSKFKELSFLVYGLGLSGHSVIKFFKKNNIENYKVWDDQQKKLFKNKRTKDFCKESNEVTSKSISSSDFS